MYLLLKVGGYDIRVDWSVGGVCVPEYVPRMLGVKGFLYVALPSSPTLVTHQDHQIAASWGVLAPTGGKKHVVCELDSIPNNLSKVEAPNVALTNSEAMMNNAELPFRQKYGGYAPVNNQISQV